MLETHLTKATAVGENNKAGVWGLRAAGCQRVFGGGAPNYAFLEFWYKFLLKTAFLNG